MGTDIRTLRHRDELGAWFDAVNMGFLRPAGRGHIPAGHTIDLDRAWAAYDGDRLVGTLRGFDRQVTIPGGTVDAAAISGVTVGPGHRRQGLLGRMITAELAAARERGAALSVLIAANWPIYGRFGYGPATETAEYRIDARTAALTPAAEAAADAAGEIGPADSATFRAEAPAVYERMRARTLGAISRADRDWDVRSGVVLDPGDDGKDRVFELLRGADGATLGYADYRVTDSSWTDGRPDGAINVVDLVADDAFGEAALWRHLWRHDWINRLTVGFRSTEEPLPWLLRDARDMRTTQRGDFMWLRLLDVAAALAQRHYPVADGLVLRVVPPVGAREGYALEPARTYRLDAGPDGARCHATTAAPEVTLPLDALGALYLGGTSATRLSRVGLLREEATGAVARADRLFAAASVPWCNTIF